MKVLSSVGAMSVVRVVSSRPTATEPDAPEPVSGLVVVIPVIVPGPVPGNVCPGAQLTTPAGEMERPVGVGLVVPEPYRKARLADGVAVLLPVASALQAKFCATAAEVPLEKALAPSFNRGEFTPTDAVALLAGVTVTPP